MPDISDKLRRSLQHLISDKEAERRYAAKLEKGFNRAVKLAALSGSAAARHARPNRHGSMRHYQVRNVHDRYRERSLPGSGRNIIAGVTKLGVYKTYTDSVLQSVVPQWATGSAFESLQLQRTWDQVNPGPPFLTGGPFKSIIYRVPTCEMKGQGTYSSAVTDNGWPIGHPNRHTDLKQYVGKFSCSSDWGNDLLSQYTNSSLSSFSPLSAYHSAAWDQLKPKIEQANVGQFLYELRDLPGQLATTANLFNNLWKDHTGEIFGVFANRRNRDVLFMPSNLADNFLNHHFGWAPFVGDVLKMVNTFLDLQSHIERLSRDNGSWMKRYRVLEEGTTETLIRRSYGSLTEPSDGIFPLTQICDSMTVDGISCKGLTDIRVRDQSRVWAVGSFRFYLPEFDSSGDRFRNPMLDLQRILTIFGARITPTLLWKITPWTWLIDWFTNAGSFVRRLDDFVVDGITSRYLYCMKQSDHYVTKTCMMNIHSGSLVLTWARQLGLKQREAADTPYGFNSPWNSLSGKQWAILAALGITRTNSGFLSRG